MLNQHTEARLGPGKSIHPEKPPRSLCPGHCWGWRAVEVTGSGDHWPGWGWEGQSTPRATVITFWRSFYPHSFSYYCKNILSSIFSLLVLCYYEDLLDFLKKLGSGEHTKAFHNSQFSIWLLWGGYHGGTTFTRWGGKDPKRSLYTHQLKAVKVCEISSNPRPFIIFTRLYLNGLAL